MKILAVHGEDERGVPRYGQYDYTDISRSFFGPAQDLFADHGKRVNFKSLNIEEDPELQGFECGTYDVVVAASVSFSCSQGLVLESMPHISRSCMPQPIWPSH
jgi:hypothetical protein